MSTKLQQALIAFKTAHDNGEDVQIPGYNVEITDNGKIKYKKEGAKRWANYNPASDVSIRTGSRNAKQIKKIEEVEEEQEEQPKKTKPIKKIEQEKPKRKQIEEVEENETIEEIEQPKPRQSKKIIPKIDDGNNGHFQNDYSLRILDKNYRKQYKEAYAKKLRIKKKVKQNINNEFDELYNADVDVVPVTRKNVQREPQREPQREEMKNNNYGNVGNVEPDEETRRYMDLMALYV